MVGDKRLPSTSVVAWWRRSIVGHRVVVGTETGTGRKGTWRGSISTTVLRIEILKSWWLLSLEIRGWEWRLVTKRALR